MTEGYDIRIRKAAPADGHALALLMNMAGEGIPAYLWSLAAEEGEDAMAFGARRVSQGDKAFSYANAWVVEMDGVVAGMLLGYRLPDTPAPVPDDVPALVLPALELEALVPGSWYVNGIAVSPGRRGRGLGTLLLRLAEDLARADGADALSLIVSEGNPGAMRLYDSIGYRVVAVRPGVPYPGNDAPGDWILMRKPLGGARRS